MFSFISNIYNSYFYPDMDLNEIRDITLHIQLSRKEFFDVTVKNNITVAKLLSDYIKVNRNENSIFKDDINITDLQKTLYQCSIVNNDHLNVLENTWAALPINTHVFISTVGDNQGSPMKIDCSYGHTVMYIKKQFSERSKIPLDKCRFVFAGKIMDLYRTVSNSSLQIGSRIHCVINSAPQ
ncbi:hypothetical protein DLAC_01306 [Tieghemostelium lacteum]|uniref:Ubiquitin-like domain-containing protein n=1 Tax=Tieghemostelium lacteum TaxID=361077 RepID=A0A152A8M9_TIELA|nr:hypothetical protein DLAC_01306 [Tieghemostelium lacteum]|eukprot:KYR02465.1 hypothetical protein DLAC_01306 [Tieghemostelium lacteum]